MTSTETRATNNSLLKKCYGEDNTTLIGNYIDQYLSEVIPCFWVKFPLPPFMFYLGVFVIYTLISIISISGNGLIVFLWYRYRAMRTASNLLLVNLCMAGLVMLSPIPLLYINLIQGGPFLALTGAKIFGFVSTVGAMAQIWLLTCLTVERAWVVWCISHVKQHRGYLISSTVDFLSMDSLSLSYTWLLMSVGWILPNILIFSSHLIVVLTYRSSMTEFAQQMGEGMRTNFLKQRLMSERKLWKASLIMLLSWTLAWTPYALMFLICISGWRDLISHHSNMWAELKELEESVLKLITHRREF